MIDAAPLAKSQGTAIKVIPHTSSLGHGWLGARKAAAGILDAEGGTHYADVFQVQKTKFCRSPVGRWAHPGKCDADCHLALGLQLRNQSRAHKHDHPFEALGFSADGQILRMATGDPIETYACLTSGRCGVTPSL